MVRTRFEALYVRRLGERWARSRQRATRDANARLIMVSAALVVTAFSAAWMGLGQCVFTLLLLGAGVPLLGLTFGRGRPRTERVVIQADAQHLELDDMRLSWTQVHSLERNDPSQLDGLPGITVRTTEGEFSIAMTSLPEVDQRLEELRALHARGQGSVSDIPESLLSMKQRE